MTITRLPSDRWEEALKLLNDSGLPTADLSPTVQTLWGSFDDGKLLGLIAWECMESEALIRSFTVDPASRHRGIGQALYQHLEKTARFSKLTTLYLLTETARGFFSKQGYHLIEREKLPDSIKKSAEFTSLCPVSAKAMMKNLG